MSTPTPARPMTCSRVPGRDQPGVDLDLAADDERVVVGAGSPQSSSRRQAGPLVDLVMRAEERRRPPGRWVRRRGSSRRDAGPLADAPARRPSASAAAASAAPTAAPGVDGRPCSSATRLEDARSRRGSPRRVTEPRWPSRKILPVSLPWPPARTTPRALIAPLNAFQSRPSGIYAAVTVCDAKRWSANSSKPSASRPARAAAAHASWRAKTPAAPSALHQPEALVDLEDDGDRRRPRRLAVGLRVAVEPQVEVEARHRRRLHRRPRPRAEAATIARPGARHPRLLRAGHDDVDAPGVHLERHGAEAGHAVDEDQRVRRRVADGRGELRDRVHHAGRRLVVGQQHGPVAPGSPARRLADRGRIGRLAPLDVELRHVRAVDRRRSWRTGRRTSRSTRRGPGRPATAC